MTMPYLYCLLIYLLTVILIGCQPPDTCYEDVVEKSKNETPGGWFRMTDVSLIKLVSLYFTRYASDRFKV